MTIDMNQFNEFAKSLKDSLDLFKNQQTEINSLKQTISDLETRMLNAKANPTMLPTARKHGFGFQDAKAAKQFVELSRAIFQKDHLVAKDMTEGVDSEGGYTVPGEYRNVLLSLMETYGLARQRCTVIPMSRDELTMPKLTGGVQVYWIGEGKTIGQTQPSFGELKLAVKKMAAMVPITSELLEDTAMAIANLLATLFAQALAKEEDRVTFMGDQAGASDPFTGMIHDPGVNVHTLPGGSTAFTAVNADHLADVIASLTPVQIAGAEWYMHRTIFNIVRKLKNSQGDYIYAEPSSNGEPGTIWGYPYNLVETFPNITQSGAGQPFMFFGNMNHYYIGDRKKMSIARSEHVGFAQDKVFLRVIQREGMAYALPETGVVVKTAAA